MGEEEKVNLMKLFSKKLNVFITITLTVLGIFIALFVTFMVKSSNKDGIHDTQIAQIFTMQERREEQLDRLTLMVGVLNTDNELAKEELKDIVSMLDDTLDRLKRTEWAVLTNDPSEITRGNNVEGK